MIIQDISVIADDILARMIVVFVWRILALDIAWAIRLEQWQQYLSYWKRYMMQPALLSR